MKSQKDRILAYMKSGKKITPAITYEKFGCLRLSERIRELLPLFGSPGNGADSLKKSWKRISKRTRVMQYWL